MHYKIEHHICKCDRETFFLHPPSPTSHTHSHLINSYVLNYLNTVILRVIANELKIRI